MRRFILHIIGFIAIVAISFLALLSQADGSYDEYYLRFTAPTQQNLVLGTSRAAQGIVPSLLGQLMDRPFYNYSFTVSTSPYGPVYLESIKKKVAPSTTNGIFILSVDPWSLSTKDLEEDNKEAFRENDRFLATTSRVAMRPNFEYLLENLNSVYRILLPKRKTMLLHQDGWLEITVPMDDSSVLKRTNSKLESYRTDLVRFKPSEHRIAALVETVEYLSKRGQVFLVRLPVHPEMARIEQELMPDFKARIDPAIQLATDYLNMSNYNQKLQYTDGNHLYKESGKTVTGIIAEWMMKNE